MFCNELNPSAFVSLRKSAFPFILCNDSKPNESVIFLKSALPKMNCNFEKYDGTLSSVQFKSPQKNLIFLFSSKSFNFIAISFSGTFKIKDKSFFAFLFCMISIILGSDSQPNPSILSLIWYKKIKSSKENSKPSSCFFSNIVRYFISLTFFWYSSLSGNSFNFSSNIFPI